MDNRKKRSTAMNYLDQILLDKLESDLRIESNVITDLNAMLIKADQLETIRIYMCLIEVSSSKVRSLAAQIKEIHDHYN